MPFTWEMPELTYNRLLKQADQRLFSDKQYFWCNKTFSALTYSNGTGFRFLVCPRSWPGFTPKRLSRNDLETQLPSLGKIEALLDDPTAVMGGITVRVTASPNGGMMGSGQRTSGMSSNASPDGG
ncbi:hypothetical protein N9N28_17680 [Rubripirellula amarantea]|nr:hypothetical protein [Rubripirellula amarantea]